MNDELSVQVIFKVEVFFIGMRSTLDQRCLLANQIIPVPGFPLMAHFVIERLVVVACLIVLDQLVVGQDVVLLGGVPLHGLILEGIGVLETTHWIYLHCGLLSVLLYFGFWNIDI